MAEIPTLEEIDELEPETVIYLDEQMMMVTDQSKAYFKRVYRIDGIVTYAIPREDSGNEST